MKLFRHYKGGIYEVMGVATNAVIFQYNFNRIIHAFHTEKEVMVKVTCIGNQMFASEHLVIYQDADMRIWARPYEMFHDSLEYEGKVVKRFTQIDL